MELGRVRYLGGEPCTRYTFSIKKSDPALVKLEIPRLPLITSSSSLTTTTIGSPRLSPNQVPASPRGITYIKNTNREAETKEDTHCLAVITPLLEESEEYRRDRSIDSAGEDPTPLPAESGEGRKVKERECSKENTRKTHLEESPRRHKGSSTSENPQETTDDPGQGQGKYSPTKDKDSDNSESPQSRRTVGHRRTNSDKDSEHSVSPQPRHSTEHRSSKSRSKGSKEQDQSPLGDSPGKRDTSPRERKKSNWRRNSQARFRKEKEFSFRISPQPDSSPSPTAVRGTRRSSLDSMSLLLLLTFRL
jgi:hypothetical protein